MNKYIAEFVGTFLLAFAVGATLTGKFAMPTPVVAAVTLGVLVYVFGGISGAHINPAITLGILSVGRIEALEAINYIVAQLAGAGVAIVASVMVMSPVPAQVTDTPRVFLGEVLGTFCLAIGVASAVFRKASELASGLTIGGSLFLGISVASSGSSGVLNPAVAMGTGSMSIGYVVGPVFGSIVAFQLYRYLAGQEHMPEELTEPK